MSWTEQGSALFLRTIDKPKKYIYQIWQQIRYRILKNTPTVEPSAPRRVFTICGEIIGTKNFAIK